MTVTDTLPGGLAFVSATPSQGTCQQASGTVTCALGSLAVGANATVGITATTSALGTLTDTAIATANEPDPNPANNIQTVNTAVVVGTDTDLAVADTGSATPVQVGTNFTYTLTATNGGPGPATGVKVMDTLPSGSVWVNDTPSAGSCTGTSTLTCTIGSLAANTSATVTVTATALASGALTNQASITGNEIDPNSVNNNAIGTNSAFYTAYVGGTGASVLTLALQHADEPHHRGDGVRNDGRAVVLRSVAKRSDRLRRERQ